MNRKHEYRMGRRLTIFRNIFFLLATALIISFYFIYDYVFGEAFPWIRGLPLAAIFLLIEALVIAAGVWWCRRLADGTLYTVTPDALEIQIGTGHKTLPWKDFERAWFGMVDFSGACPVRYRVKGEEFRPSVYLENVWKLHEEIVEHIRPYAEIEEGLEKKIHAFV